MSDKKLKIGITQGDTNGIGWEVILKALSDTRMAELFTPIVYGSLSAAAHYQDTIKSSDAVSLNKIGSAEDARRKRVNLIECGDVESIQAGVATKEAAQAAVEALCRAMADLKAGAIDALVTAPFNKESVNEAGFAYTGHTEYCSAELSGEAMMIMCSDIMRVGLVTKHIPLSQISQSITKDKIINDLKTLRQTLKADFGVVEPRIAVLSLNPHAGDGGILGREEMETIKPAIVEAFGEGVLAFGPFAVDGLFSNGGYTKYDGILAMYHDQGLTPFKSLTSDGVNFTAGLSAVRLSPDHGVAYDIAGKNLADPQSMRNAIYTAADIVARRAAYREWSKSPLRRAEREKSTRDLSVKDLKLPERED